MKRRHARRPIHLLSAHALDALGHEVAALLEAHLQECARCSAEMDGARSVLTQLSPAGPVAPPQLRTRILSAISR